MINEHHFYVCQSESFKKPKIPVPSYTRALVLPTVEMIRRKKVRQNELIKTIKELQKQNENKFDELMAAEKQKEQNTCQTCLQPIPMRYDPQFSVLKSPSGKLTEILPEGEANSEVEKTSIVKKKNFGAQIPEGFTLECMILKSSDGTFTRLQEEPFYQ